MTTPRVTVPVEPTDEMMKAGKMASAPAAWHFLSDAYRAMLSAAPAPEGGAMSIWSDARNVFVRYAELFAMTERYEEASAIADKAAREIEALATREEAPAEAGDDCPTLADLHTIKGWLYGLSAASDLTDVVADGGVSIGDCYQQEAREFVGRIERIINALRAQPPAREDAKACYDCATDRPHRTSEACTHPAPDTLREAVEAARAVYSAEAEPFCSACLDSKAEDMAEAFDAALQAEQKGGAA